MRTEPDSASGTGERVHASRVRFSQPFMTRSGFPGSAFRTPSRLGLLVMPLLLSSACDRPLFDFGDQSATTAPGAEEPALATRPETSASLPLYRIQVRFESLRTRVPAGLFSGSEKIWNHLDEEAIPSEVRQLLRNNGLRAGRGRVQDWEPIRALLEAGGPVQTSSSHVQVSNGLPLVLELTAPRPEQTLFLIRADGSSAGATFRDCTDQLRIEYAIDPQDPAAVLLEVMPELLAPRPEPPNFSLRPTLPEDLVRPSRVLRELTVPVRIGPDEFLAFGPSPAVNDSEHLVGTLLLCDRIEGQRLESMYFITPRVIRTEAGLQP